MSTISNAFLQGTAVAGATLVLVLACSPGPAPVSQSLRDPSNPNAPEGTIPPVASIAATAPPEGHAHHHGATTDTSTDAGTVYTCPMHPEVTSSTPGLCPKCNMKLVPKK
jgi:hypothetical protein